MSESRLLVQRRNVLQQRLLALFCGTGTLCASTIALAQTAPDTAPAAAQLDTVVVTARRTSESLQSVPVSVIAVSQAELENNDATDLSKLGELAPQVQIGSYGTGTGAIFTIRGIGTSPADAGLDQSVLVVADGVPMSNGSLVNSALFDMQQVEIMEGPQALFFGKNSPAGVIALHSADPTPTLTGYLKGGYEFEAGERFLEGAISGPLIDGLTGRLAIRADKMDGWIDNDAQSIPDPFYPGVIEPGPDGATHHPGGHNVAGRLSLHWAPTDNFDASFRLTIDNQRLNGNDAYFEVFCSGGAAAPVELTVPEVGSDCSKNQRVNVTGTPPQFTVNFPYGNNGVPYATSNYVLPSLTLDLKLDPVTLTSTTGYYNQRHYGNGDDFGPYAQIFSTDHRTNEQVTQELRANTEFSGPLNFMAGGYFEHDKRGFFDAGDLLNLAINPTVNNYSTFEIANTQTDNYYSAFGQFRWNIVPSLELAAGARYSHDKRTSDLVNLANNPDTAALGLQLYPQGQPLHAESASNNVSPEATLTWHPAQEQTLYGAYKQGYKAGGISAPSLLYAFNNAQNLQFGPEKTHGFEIGYKADLFDRTLRLDVTAYRYNYSNLQVVIVNSQFFSFQIANAGTALTSGVEGSFEWLANNDLSFNGNFGYNDAHYVSYPGAQCYAGQTAAQGCVGGFQDLSGQQLNRAPRWNFMLGGDYKIRVIPHWTLDLSLDGTYSSAYQTASDYAPAGLQTSFWRLNAGAHFIHDKGHFEFAVIGRDLTNAYTLLTTDEAPLRATGDYLGTFNRPREVILQAEYHL
jgi:iron complex outermembrane recepter protein